MARVLLLLCRGTEVLEAASFFDVLGWAKEEAGLAVEVVTAGREREVRCAFGLRMVPDVLVSDVRIEEFDALAIPGGFETWGYFEDAWSAEVSDLVRAFRAARLPIATICTGALTAARAGILEDAAATTYDSERRRGQLASFRAVVEDGPIVETDGITTSDGPSTAAEVAFRLLETLVGVEHGARVRAAMGFR